MHKQLRQWGLIVLGAFVYAVGVNAFLVGNHLAEGGFVGISVILLYKLGWPLGLSFFVLNIPVLILGWKLFGKEFIIRTSAGVVLVSIFSSVTKNWKIATNDPLLAALYAGVITGVGLGLIFRAGATTGGSDVIARTMKHFRGIAMGRTMFAIDFCVISVVALLIGRQTAMYSLVALFVASRVIDFFLEGVNAGKALMIISEKHEVIAKEIHQTLHRGTTFLTGYGGYTGAQKRVIYCVVPRDEIIRIQNIVSRIDPAAFVVVNNVHEVLGEGFTFQGSSD